LATGRKAHAPTAGTSAGASGLAKVLHSRSDLADRDRVPGLDAHLGENPFHHEPALAIVDLILLQHIVAVGIEPSEEVLGREIAAAAAAATAATTKAATTAITAVPPTLGESHARAQHDADHHEAFS
jgi:hypothetical protein